MASGVRAPESRRGGDLWRAAKLVRALLTASLAALVSFAAGCPAREVGVLLSPSGIGYLASACAPQSSDICLASNHAGLDFAGRSFEARLFLLTPSDGVAKDASKCMTVPPCFDPRVHNSCLADALNQQLDGAIPNGLGFDGLRHPEDVRLILAFYQPTDPSDTDAACAEVNLVACAGLAPQAGGGNFDISCASCQGGANAPEGRDNTPCPTGTGCFLLACDELLRKNGAQ
jgi:hypothetical protein